MFATSAAVLALAAAVAYAQDLSIQAPSLAQCANTVINFSGGSGPYYVAILHSENPCDSDAIEEFYDVIGNSVSYTPALLSSTQVFVYVEDANGQEAWSDLVTIGGGDSSCLPNQDTSYNTPPDNSYTNNPPTDNLYNPPTYNPPTYNPPTDNSPTDNSPTNNPPTYNPTTDDQTTDYQTTDNTTGNGDSYQSLPDDSSSSSSSAEPTSATGTYEAPYNPTTTTSVDTEDSSVSVQSTNNNSNNNSNSDKDTTPANANDKTDGATGLAVSALTALSAVLVVSFGLF